MANKIGNISEFINVFLADLSDRQKEVIRGRYGLDGSEPVTLQAIGDRHSITRERVRQIEAGALALLRKKLESPYVKSFIETAIHHLKSAGGIKQEADYLEGLRKGLLDKSASAMFQNGARFVLELTGKISSYRDNYDKHWHAHWYLSEGERKRAQGFVAKLITALNARKYEVVAKNKFDEIFSSTAKTAKLIPETAKSYLAISKRFAESPFGGFGLADWQEINPKTARDWAYLILKKEKRPLHFSEISKAISRHRKDKRTNLQTVHNELIKDDRFVLVGRGTYGLKESGLIPGTAREIIAHVLKKHGPLPSREVINLVLEQRLIKEGTILINLQNRKHFGCSADGRYFLREA